MTVAEIEAMCEDHEVAIGYMGHGPRGLKSRRWTCTIQPTMRSSRWEHGEFFMRGSGSTLEAALHDAVAQLSAFLLTRPAPDRDE